MTQNLGRNDICHCGSGKKYKKCHLEKDESADRKAREKAALNAAKVAAEEAKNDTSATPTTPHKPVPVAEKKGWLGKVAGKMSFFKGSTQRRTPSANKGG